MNTAPVGDGAAGLRDLLRRARVRVDDAIPLAESLLAGGLSMLEVTLRTPVALPSIERIATHLPGMQLAAGTLVRADDMPDVARAGAAFAVSPGITPTLCAAARSVNLPLLPGAATAGDIMIGLEHGLGCFKFFPARAAGGVETLAAFAGPFPDVAFCPTGGITANSMGDYLALPNVVALGGSWMVPNEALRDRDWQRINALARACAPA